MDHSEIGENAFQYDDLCRKIGGRKTECICEAKYLAENPEAEYKYYICRSYTTCPPILVCHYFDFHEFEYTHCREDTTLATLLNDWQKAIGNPHKFNVCFVKVKKLLLEKFDSLYKQEQLRLENKLDTRLIINHAMPMNIVYDSFNRQVQFICQYFLSEYTHYPEEWEGIISKSLADLPEYKSEVDTLAVLDTVKKSFLPKIKTKKERAASKQKPLISAKEKEQEEWDEDYYTHMMSGEWE